MCLNVFVSKCNFPTLGDSDSVSPKSQTISHKIPKLLVKTLQETP